MGGDLMSNKDFQNGFALGLASGGVVSEGNYAEAFNSLYSASFMNATIERIDFYIANPFVTYNGFFRKSSR